MITGASKPTPAPRVVLVTDGCFVWVYEAKDGVWRRADFFESEEDALSVYPDAVIQPLDPSVPVDPGDT